jgi:hypothetical protein
MDRYFTEAVAYHRSRVPMTDSAVAKLSSDARLRAFYASGLARQAEAVATHRLIDEALRNGTTAAQFRADYAKAAAANGGSILPVSRQNLVIRQATGLAYAGGRMEKLRAVSDTRPIWMYPLGPHDEKTTSICINLEGFMAEANSPVWEHIAPPNHFEERHLQVVSMTREQAAARAEKTGGKVWEDVEGGGEYPVIDGQQMLPDAGFDMQPSLLASDSRQLVEEFSKLAGEMTAGDAETYGLASIGDLAEEEIVDAPELAAASDAEEGWAALRDAAGIPDELETTFVPDMFGDGAIVNRGSYDAIFGDTDPELAPLLPDLLTDPAEVWFVPFATDAGVEVVKRFFGAFDLDGETVWLWADQAPSGWIARGGVSGPEQLDALRKGYLVFSKVPRKAKAARNAPNLATDATGSTAAHHGAEDPIAPQASV